MQIQAQSEQYCIPSLRIFVSFCLYECMLSISSVREGCAKVMNISSFTSFAVKSLKSVFSSQFRFLNMRCVFLFLHNLCAVPSLRGVGVVLEPRMDACHRLKRHSLLFPMSFGCRVWRRPSVSFCDGHSCD